MAFCSQIGSLKQARIPCYLNLQVECWGFLDFFFQYKFCGDLVKELS